MSLWRRLQRFVGLGDRAARDEVERILLPADLGVAATQEVLERLARNGERGPEALEAVLVDLLGTTAPSPTLARAAAPPTVVLVFGVNGSGKTTTVAKLGARLKREGRTFLLAAADTFRAGAVEQLKVWADRLDAPFVGARAGGDPAAVAFDAVAAAVARGVDTVLIDTAGRLHTDERLVDELKKVVRVVAKRLPGGAPHESLLVLDGTVGQNAVSQARLFAAAVPLTGLVVTKLDGTAKGGSVVAVRRALTVPVRFVGTGETLDALAPFEPAVYARRLVHGS